MSVYIAAPFFNPEQVRVVEEIENLLYGLGIRYFSPRETGVVLKDLPKQERKIASEQVYSLNIKELRASTLVLAYTDDFDPGTIWETGFAKALGTPVITFSTHAYGSNVMLSQSCLAHFKTLDSIATFLVTVGRELNLRAFPGEVWETFLKAYESEFDSSDLEQETTT